MKTITVELVRTNLLTRWPCHVCGGHTEKVPVLAEVQRGPFDGFRVCELCLERRDFDAQLEARAKSFEAEARDLRSLVGRLEVPSFEAWRAAVDGADWAANREELSGYVEVEPTT